MSTTVMEAPVKLTTFDRCDSCGAQAFIMAELNGSGLMFCNHHGKKNIEGLKAQGFEVWDFSHMINENPSVSTVPAD